MHVLADWTKGKNLPSFKTVFVSLATMVNWIVSFFVSFRSTQVRVFVAYHKIALLLLVECRVYTCGG